MALINIHANFYFDLFLVSHFKNLMGGKKAFSVKWKKYFILGGLASKSAGSS